MKNYKIKSRYYFHSKIIEHSVIELSNNIANHLLKVLRCKILDNITLFNKEDGEWLCSVISVTKHTVSVKVVSLLKIYTAKKHTISLAYAALKQEANNFVLEKATELNIFSITNIITNRTVNKALPSNKIIIKVLQAVEQCQRLDIPFINEAVKLEDFIKNNTNILWLNENLQGTELKDYKIDLTIPNNFILLVGPEGGFSNEENNILSNHKNVSSVYLKNNILKAETAILASIVTLSNKF